MSRGASWQGGLWLRSLITTSAATAESLLHIVLGDEGVDQLDDGLLLIAVDGFELLKAFEKANVTNGLLRFVGTLADEKRIRRCMKARASAMRVSAEGVLASRSMRLSWLR